MKCKMWTWSGTGAVTKLWNAQICIPLAALRAMLVIRFMSRNARQSYLIIHIGASRRDSSVCRHRSTCTHQRLWLRSQLRFLSSSGAADGIHERSLEQSPGPLSTI